MSETIWLREAAMPSYSPLAGDLETEVAVVGAGVTGLTTALLLARAGRRVVVVDRSAIGHGTSGHTTAHLTALLDAEYRVIEKRFDAETARLVCASMVEAIDRIEALSSELGLPEHSFARVPGWYFAETAEGLDEVREEGAAAARAGLSVRLEDHVPLPWATAGGLRVEGQARLHAGHYLAALARAAEAAGCRIHAHSPVTRVSDGAPAVLRLPGGSLRAAEVILATHTPAGVSPLQMAIPPYRSYVLAVRRPEPFVEGLFWDTAEPYRYVRRVPSEAGELVLVGGADHKTGSGDETEAYAALERWTLAQLPGAQTVLRWSAQLYDPTDGLPFIGRRPGSEHVWLGTGYAGDGITFGTLAGWMLAQRISGVATAYDQIYRPTRLKAAGTGRFLAKNAEVAKHFIGDRLSGGPSLSTLAAGEGCVTREGTRQVAAYREEGGRMRTFSAVCPHLKCVVHWNEAERSFDCPCHGSRFDTTGAVLEGPSRKGLEALEAGEEKTVRS